ncbi:MAG: hypothetical protein AAB883_00110 [Patescibacteria group bacterium]
MLGLILAVAVAAGTPNVYDYAVNAEHPLNLTNACYRWDNAPNVNAELLERGSDSREDTVMSMTPRPTLVADETSAGVYCVDTSQYRSKESEDVMLLHASPTGVTLFLRATKGK